MGRTAIRRHESLAGGYFNTRKRDLSAEPYVAIRTLMWEAADHAGVDPDRVGFVAALRRKREERGQ